MTNFQKSLKKATLAFPKRIRFLSYDRQAVADLKAKAEAHVKAFPKETSVFDTMYRPIMTSGGLVHHG